MVFMLSPHVTLGKNGTMKLIWTTINAFCTNDASFRGTRNFSFFFFLFFSCPTREWWVIVRAIRGRRHQDVYKVWFCAWNIRWHFWKFNEPIPRIINCWNEQQLRDLSMFISELRIFMQKWKFALFHEYSNFFFLFCIFLSPLICIYLWIVSRLLSERSINADLLSLTKKSIVGYSGTGYSNER